MKNSVNLTCNPKQLQFYTLATGAADGENEYRHLFYGGAIRGGKTFVSLAVFADLATRYPGSRWHVFRRDFPALEATTIPSFLKIIGDSTDWKWHRNRSNYHVEHKISGAKIFFKGENFSHDPALTGLLGLETNGILFEQIDELSEELWQMACSRIGSWYIEPMPAPLTVATFNPTQRWIKPMIYETYVRDELAAPYFYMPALPSDNAYVTSEQWSAWGRLDDRYQLQFIKGDWTNLEDKNNLWAFAFDKEKHCGSPEMVPEEPLYLSFDFNRNPICCSVIQQIDKQIRVLETIKLANSNIYEMCAHICARYPHAVYKVTGDATGQNLSALLSDNSNYYHAIKNQLNISVNQIHVPTSNPALADNQMLINAILSKYDVVIHSENAKGLIYDLEHVRRDPDGRIVKGDRRDPSQQADALDTFRYWCNTFMKDFIRERVVVAV